MASQIVSDSARGTNSCTEIVSFVNGYHEYKDIRDTTMPPKKSKPTAIYVTNIVEGKEEALQCEGGCNLQSPAATLIFKFSKQIIVIPVLCLLFCLRDHLSYRDMANRLDLWSGDSSN